MNSWLCSTLVLLSRNCVGKKCRNLSAGVSLFSLFAFSALNVHCCRPVFFFSSQCKRFSFLFYKAEREQNHSDIHISTHTNTHVHTRTRLWWCRFHFTFITAIWLNWFSFCHWLRSCHSKSQCHYTGHIVEWDIWHRVRRYIWFL